MALNSPGSSAGWNIRRPSPAILAAKRWETFDLLRAWAASLVFVFHYCAFAAPQTQGIRWLDGVELLVAWSGSMGTNLLLLISGFLVAKSVDRPSYRYASYLWKRVGRIYPPYLLVVSAELLFILAVPKFQRPDLNLAHLQDLLKNILLWPGLFPSRPALTVAWTLSWIMAGYVLLPAPLAWLRRHIAARRLRFSVLVGALLGYTAWTCITHLMLPRLGYILCGCAAYQLAGHCGPGLKLAVRSRWLVLAAVACFGVRLGIDLKRPLPIGEEATTFCYVLFGLTAVSLLAMAAIQAQVRHPERWSAFPWNVVHRFGRTGYSFYLLHGPITKVFTAAIFPRLLAAGAPAWSYWAVMPVCFMVAAIASAAMYRLLEQPLQRWLDTTAEPAVAPMPVARRAAGAA